MSLRIEPETLATLSTGIDRLYQNEATALVSTLTSLKRALNGAWGSGAAQAFDDRFGGWLADYQHRSDDLRRIAAFLRAAAAAYRETDTRLCAAVGVGPGAGRGGGKGLAKPAPRSSAPTEDPPEPEGWAAWWHDLMVGLGYERDRIAFKLPTDIAAQAIPLASAQALFADLQANTEIAWRYPIDGCYARADAMAEIMRSVYGIDPPKIWAFSDNPDDDGDTVPLLSELGNQSNGLTVDTDTPYDVVTWGYHVAPVIPVTQEDGTIQYMVIDPSIMAGPVTTEEWFDRMNAGPTLVADITRPGEAPLGLIGSGYWPGDDPIISDYTERVNDFYNFCADNGVVCTVDALTGQAFVLVDRNTGFPVDPSEWYTP